MASQLLTFNSAQDAVHMSWAEPYVTSGLNQRDMIVRPRGTYRGFRLSVTGTDLNVTIVPDPVGNDHVAVVNDTLGIYALEVRRIGGSFNIDFSGVLGTYANQTVVLALVGYYTPGTPTSIVLQVYTQAQFQSAPEAPYVAVLGTATLSATAVTAVNYGITTGSVGTPVQRTEAWAQQAPESVPWSPILINGGFDRGPTGSITGYEIAGWLQGTTVGSGTWVLETTDVNPTPGPNLLPGYQALEFDQSVASSGAHGTIVQTLGLPVSPGQLVQYRFWIKGVTPTSGSPLFAITYLTDTGANVSPFTLTIPNTVLTGLGSSGTGWQMMSGMTTVPAGAVAINYVIFETGANYGTVIGAVLRLDDLQVWIESNSSQRPNLSEEMRMDEYSAGWVLLQDPNATVPADYTDATTSALLRYDQTFYSPGAVVLERRDQSATATPPNLNVKGQLTLGQNLIGTAASAQTARLELPASSSGSTFTLLQETPPSIVGSGHSGARIYVSNTGDFYIVNNCSWNNTSGLWTYDDSVVSRATALVISSETTTSVALKLRTGAGTWNNSSWTDTTTLMNSTGGMILASALEVLTSLGVGTAAPSGTGNVTMTGGLSVPGQSGDTSPVIYSSIPSVPNRKLMWEMAGYGVNTVRVYQDWVPPGADTYALTITLGAGWNGSEWSLDNPGIYDAGKFIFGADLGLACYFYPAASSNPFPDSSWQQQWVLGNSGFNFSQGLQITQAAPGAPQVNTLYKDNIVKAWANVNIIAGDPAPSIDEGFNAPSVSNYYTATSSNDTFNVNFGTPMVDTNYVVELTISCTSHLNIMPGLLFVQEQSTSFVGISFADFSGSDQSFPGFGDEFQVFVVIHGKQ
jgi:hypothetical protein